MMVGGISEIIFMFGLLLFSSYWDMPISNKNGYTHGYYFMGS